MASPTSADRATSRVLLHRAARYGLAVLVVTAAALARWAFPDVLTQTPYLAFYPAIVAAAALGGCGPGVLATVLSALSLDLLFTSPLWQFSTDAVHLTQQAIFLSGGTGVSLLARILRKAMARYRAVAEYTHDWEFWMAPDGRFLYISPACINVTGYPASMFLADPDLAHRIIHPDDQASYDQHRGYADKACTTPEVEFRIIHRDGSVRWIGHACVPIYDDAGTFLGIRGSNRDITERKLAEETRREAEIRYRTLFESIDEGFCVIQMIFDDNDRPVDYSFLEVNPSFAKQTGLPNAQGKRMRELVPQHEEFWFETYGKIALTGEPARFQSHAAQLHGWYDVYAFRFGEAENRQVAILFSDITADIAQREALVAAKRSAERAKADAEKASQTKDHFMAVLSHELRNPLTPVLATASMLQQDERLDAETRQHLEVIRRNAMLEARLIDDLLDVTRISRGKVELDRRPVELCTILRHAVEVCQPDIESRRLHFGLDIKDPPHTVHADPGRLQQVFWNIIKNAVKFTPHDGCVGVRAYRRDDSVLVEVSDSGVGLEPEALTRIFNAFEQAEASTTRQFGGLGLGLAISKALVEMQGGTITAYSEGKGKGAKFTVTLPLSSAPAPVELPRPSSVTADGRAIFPLRILLVEDHGDTARIMTQLLLRHGHEIHAAGDVATALELAAAQRFDLLLSDLGLPDGSGLDLMRALRARGCIFPAIALSGYGQEQDVRQSMEAGFSLHMTKPVDFPRLSEAVAALTGRGTGAAGQTFAEAR